MKIQATPNPQLNKLPKPAHTNPTPVPQDSFVSTYGGEMLIGAGLSVLASVPVLGAVTNWNVGAALDQPKEHGQGLSHFEIYGGLAARGASVANLAGTVAMFQGNAPLALGLLMGGGVVSGALFALGMDGGSMASDLGLQP